MPPQKTNYKYAKQSDIAIRKRRFALKLWHKETAESIIKLSAPDRNRVKL